LAFEGKKGSKYFPVLKLKSFLSAFDTQKKKSGKTLSFKTSSRRIFCA